jgi:NADPH-dependent 2,4-dienoyl-CoA reductase/sulfur reductase-like enzyme/rhodanese-related sulfurtransferase
MPGSFEVHGTDHRIRHNKSSMKLVIIGGVAGGMSAATRARRVNESAEIIVLERSGLVSYANCGLPYYIAGRITPEPKLFLTNPKQLADRFRIDARVNQEVTQIDLIGKTVSVHNLQTAERYSLPFDKLILATGASAIVPAGTPILENAFTLRSVEDTRAIQTHLQNHQPKSAVIAGAGFIGLEMAEALTDRGVKVTIVEKAPQVLPPLDFEMARTVQRTLEKHGVVVQTGKGIASISDQGVVLDDGSTLATEMILLSIGVRPNTQLAADAGLALGDLGGVAVDEFQLTSHPDVYAVGDMVETIHQVTGKSARIPLAGPANRQGRFAGEHAVSGKAVSPGRPLGTAIVEVFETSAAITGLSERAAKAANFDCDTSYVFANNHAGYYPGAQPMRLKLIYEKGSQRVLGAQAVGGAGVDKRMDVVATAIHFGATLEDLTQLDLAYAPQFGSAKDPVHLAAFVALNQESGMLPAVAPWQLPQGAQLVDVRTTSEFERGHLPGSIHIPVDELRERVTQLDSTKPVVIYCQVGQRGHVATQVLRQHGFQQVFNMKGGYGLAEVVGG